MQNNETKKVIAIMQPTYLPWLGYFEMINKVDEFVFLDNVQLVKRSWGVRNRIKTANGEMYLTVPIKKTKSRDETFYQNAEINYNENWIKKHLNALKMNYSKSFYYEEIDKLISSLIEQKFVYLADLNISIIEAISKKIGINTYFKRASNIEHIEGRKDDLLVSICKALNASTYLSAQGSAEYIESKNPGGAFSRNHIQLYYHNYKHPEYRQQFGGFIPNLSIIDLLFNEGYTAALSIVNSQN